MNRPRRVVGLLPTISFVVLFFLLLAVAAGASIVVDRFRDGGPGMLLIAFVGFAALIAQWLLARRNAPLWPVVLIPCLLVLVAGVLLSAEMADVRSAMLEPEVEPVQMRWFQQGAGEVLNLPALGGSLASLGLSHAVWLAASRIRRRRGNSRAEAGAVATAAVGVLTALLMLGWRWHEGDLRFDALELAPCAALLTGLGLLVAVLALRGGARDDDRVRQSTSDFVYAGLAAAASAAMMGAAAHARVLSAVFGAVSGESLDPSQKARIVGEGAELAALELGFGWTGVGLVFVLVSAALLSARLLRAVEVTPSMWLATAALAIALPLPWMQASALDREAPDYRPGEAGELVEDRSVPRGILWVTLEGLTGGTDPADFAEVRVTGAAPAKWRPGARTVVSVEPGSRFEVSVGEPYLARVAGPFTMPSVRGARVKIGVLRTAPGPVWTETSEAYDNDRILQLDTTDPSSFRLLWTQRDHIYSARQLPRSMAILPEELRQAWNAAGYHKNDADRRFDTAVIRYLGPPDLDELVQYGKALDAVERSLRGERVGAFKVFVLAVKQYAEGGLEPGELERVAQLEPQEAVEAIPGVIERCRVKCPQGNDVFGRLIGQSCGELRCTVPDLAGLHMKLAEALVSRGDVPGATRQFERALLLNPAIGLDVGATAEAREAFQALRVPRVGVRAGALTVNGCITPQQIAAVFEGRMGLYRACGALLTAPAQCRIAMRFVIVADGGITNLANGGSDCPSSEAVQCVINNTRGAVFPAPQGGIATVIAPFLFNRW